MALTATKATLPDLRRGEAAAVNRSAKEHLQRQVNTCGAPFPVSARRGRKMARETAAYPTESQGKNLHVTFIERTRPLARSPAARGGAAFVRKVAPYFYPQAPDAGHG